MCLASSNEKPEEIENFKLPYHRKTYQDDPGNSTIPSWQRGRPRGLQDQEATQTADVFRDLDIDDIILLEYGRNLYKKDCSLTRKRCKTPIWRYFYIQLIHPPKSQNLSCLPSNLFFVVFVCLNQIPGAEFGYNF